MRLSRKILLVVSLLTLVACASQPKDDFAELKEGMYKYDVIDIMGVPKATQRWQGKDRWIYRYFDQETQVTKEVHFTESKVVYVGDAIRPEISAEEQDQRNDQENAELEKKYAQRKIEIKNQMLDFTTPGTDSNATVPQFEPINE